MAVSAAPQTIQRATLSATPDVALQVDIAPSVRRVEVRFFDAGGSFVPGKLALLGTDGAAVNAAHMTIGEGELYSIVAGGVGGSVFVASPTASAVVEIAAWVS
jgi:hypothetical protein